MALFPTRILVAVSSGPSSHHALEAAIELARDTGSPLHLVHVKLDDPKLRGRPTSPASVQQMGDQAATLLQALHDELTGRGVEVAGTHARAGDRVDRVLRRLQEELEAGLLVVGAGRSAAVARRLAGTTAPRLSGGLPTSLLVVRGEG